MWLRVVYVLCCFFLFGGMFNIGFSRFWLATPFGLLAIAISKAILKRSSYILTILFCFSIVPVNLSLEINPLMFPILNDGHVTIKKFGHPPKVETKKIGGIHLTHPDFGTYIYLEIEGNRDGERRFVRFRPMEMKKIVYYMGQNYYGEYYGNDIGREELEEMTINKPLVNNFFMVLSTLMSYPLLLFAIFDFIQGLGK